MRKSSICFFIKCHLELFCFYSLISLLWTIIITYWIPTFENTVEPLKTGNLSKQEFPRKRTIG